MNTLIRFEHVSVSFDDACVIKDLSFDVMKGDKIIIRGPSGKGKSTIIKLLLGVVSPSSGIIYYQNEPLVNENVWQIRTHTAYVPQDYAVSDAHVQSLLDEIFAYKANKHRLTGKETIKTLLRTFDLPENILGKNFNDLSGGEKQRLIIILAIMQQKEIFLLDEITSSLDAALKKKVAHYFTHKIPGTVIAISHDKDWLDAKNITTIRMK